MPVGLLEYLPPVLNERPQLWRGRDQLETLMGSDNYRDWITIRFVFRFSSLLCDVLEVH